MKLQVVRIDRAARELSKTPLIVFIGPLLTEIETIVHLSELMCGSKSGSLIFWIHGTHFRVTTAPSSIFIFHFRPPLKAALLLAIIASAAVSRVRAFHIPQSRPIHKEVSLHASTTDSNNNDDLWNADISPLQQQRHN
eukprot:scaffold8626_cov202-Skeletonema_dohrnii-CCMP3373.AAC.1